jgi:hypothetical protein
MCFNFYFEQMYILIIEYFVKTMLIGILFLFSKIFYFLNFYFFKNFIF